MFNLPKNISIHELEKKYGKFDFCRTMTILSNFEEIMRAAKECKLWSYTLSEDKKKMIISPFTSKEMDADGNFLRSEKEIRPEDFSTTFIITVN